MSTDNFDIQSAADEFEAWYEKCVEAGIQPEDVVESIGEMKLLVNQDQIDAYERGCE